MFIRFKYSRNVVFIEGVWVRMSLYDDPTHTLKILTNLVKNKRHLKLKQEGIICRTNKSSPHRIYQKCLVMHLMFG
jgi:hypothetical protein